VTLEWRAAARSGDVETLERLLAAGHDINAKDEHGQTALMVAARDGRTAVVQLLVGRGADLNHTAKFRLTALMLAVVNGREPIVRALVEAGADLSVRGSGAPGFHEKTALDLALAQGRDEQDGIVRSIRAAGTPEAS
jgi:ankyrin repeat protein